MMAPMVMLRRGILGFLGGGEQHFGVFRGVGNFGGIRRRGRSIGCLGGGSQVNVGGLRKGCGRCS